ncbi:hypothetical protein PRIPAC_86762 [Pristionchus pacificus]|uniref:Transmembrane ion channel n=1 Tax=Pristionchus pacificus TaxID=54126 RepID=A0A2A6BUW6_PRIPA|nr:hypothetical protein PRIPAC_86762 [Pristionchus pacificus]|eukprot:PDM69551.1 transmembrane ion channel [Pristionchus pacificus]
MRLLLFFFAVAAASDVSRMRSLLVRQLKQVLQKRGDSFKRVFDEKMKDYKFGVEATIDEVELFRVNEEKPQTVEISFNITSLFQNPFLQWDPNVIDNITEVELDSTLLFVPRIDGCRRTLRVQAVVGKRSRVSFEGLVRTPMQIWTSSNCKLSFGAKPHDSHSCLVCLSTDNVDFFDVVPEGDLRVRSSSNDWEASGIADIWAEGFMKDQNDGRNRKIAVKLPFSRAHRGLTHAELVVLSIVTAVLVQFLYSNRMLSLAAGVLITIGANYRADCYFFWWKTMSMIWLCILISNASAFAIQRDDALRKYLQSAAKEGGVEYMKVSGFHVRGAVQRIDVTDVVEFEAANKMPPYINAAITLTFSIVIVFFTIFRNLSYYYTTQFRNQCAKLLAVLVGVVVIYNVTKKIISLWKNEERKEYAEQRLLWVVKEE